LPVSLQWSWNIALDQIGLAFSSFALVLSFMIIFYTRIAASSLASTRRQSLMKGDRLKSKNAGGKKAKEGRV